MPTCLITAANRGIGYELARAALDSGWTVYGSVRTQQSADETAERLGKDFHPLVFDVRDHAAVRAVAGDLDTPLNLLINNAGIISPERQSALDMDSRVLPKPWPSTPLHLWRSHKLSCLICAGRDPVGS